MELPLLHLCEPIESGTAKAAPVVAGIYAGLKAV
jgi:hypothetical protein